MADTPELPEQPAICFLFRRKELMPDGSIGAVFIGEFAGDRGKDLRLTIAQAKTLRDQLIRNLEGESL